MNLLAQYYPRYVVFDEEWVVAYYSKVPGLQKTELLRDKTELRAELLAVNPFKWHLYWLEFRQRIDRIFLISIKQTKPSTPGSQLFEVFDQL